MPHQSVQKRTNDSMKAVTAKKDAQDVQALIQFVMKLDIPVYELAPVAEILERHGALKSR